MTNKQKKQLALLLLELVLVFFNTAVFAWVWFRFYASRLYLEPFWERGNYVVIAVFLVLYCFFARLYGVFDLTIARVSGLIYSNLIAVVMTNALMYVLSSLLIRHLPAVWPLIFGAVLSVALSFPWAYLSAHAARKLIPPDRILLLYDNESARANGEEIIRKTTWRFKMLGQEEIGEDADRAVEAIRRAKAEAVMVCGIHSSTRNTILKYCVDNDITAYVRPNIGDYLVNSAEDLQLANLPVMMCRRAAPGLVYLFGKRFFDIVLSLLGLIVFSPFMIAAAVAIKAYDRGPVLYKQVRLTKDRKKFYVYKFRSMRVDAEKDGVARLSAKGDDRITPVGKLIRAIRVDEMPQIFCILKGDMSIVGPRPERPSIAAEYEKEMPEFALRLQVKAGLTGYAQVYGKYNTEPYDKLQMDLRYISKQSFMTDLMIILATIKILFMPESTEGVDYGQTTAKKKRQDGRE